MKIKNIFFILIPFLMISNKGHGTFSMVALDLKTNEAASILATCFISKEDVKIADFVVVHSNGNGIMNRQSDINLFSKIWLATSFALMSQEDEIYSAKVINTFLAKPFNDPNFPVRQFATVKKYKPSGSSAHVYTGNHVYPESDSITGVAFENRFTYAIAGNLLKNKDTLKKIESKFKETNGSLADKMISAFESIPDDISYGDKRCIENYNLSSNKAFLRTFHNEKLIINIEVFSDNNKTDATYLLSEKYHESKD